MGTGSAILKTVGMSFIATDGRKRCLKGRGMVREGSWSLGALYPLEVDAVMKISRVSSRA